MNLLSEILAIIFVFVVSSIAVIASLRIIKEKLARLSEETSAIETRIDHFRSYESYFANKLRSNTSLVVEKEATELKLLRPFARIHPTYLDSVKHLEDRIERARGFLGSYTAEYVRKKCIEHSNFFGGMKRQLSEKQVEAVVKDDEYNLVVAAAGSGKTAVLVARIAYLVRTGVPPDRILALAYGKKASEEMQERLCTEYGISSVEIRTFHSYAKELARRYSPKFRTGVADEDEVSKFMRETINTLISKNREYTALALNYAVCSNTYEADPAEHPDPKEYYEFMKRQRYTTLNGKRMDSIAERDIGNFLFLNQVDFKHGSEARARWAPTSKDYRDYEPDFVLPEYGDLCIEHWAFSRDGLVPVWFSPTGSALETTREYRRRMEWKKQVFATAKRDLIETFSYQWSEGTLLEELKTKLLERGVNLREMSLDQVLHKLDQTMPRPDHLLNAISSFINNAKANATGIVTIKERIHERKWTPRQRMLARLALPVWELYERWLLEENKLDFNDMIILAIDALASIKNGIEDRPYHILIDEFQDITNSQIKLIRLLKGEDEQVKMFCVGDDWQSIFSFAGSDVNNIVHFDQHFPYAEKTFLTTNYRCPKNIVELSNRAIDRNRSKQKKEVVAASHVVVPVEHIRMQAGESGDYDQWELREAERVLTEIMMTKEDGESIIVMARYNRRKDDLERKCHKVTHGQTRYLSIHSAKGKEADYILLLGCIRGKYGFPSEFMNGDEINIARQEDETHDANERIEEERRLLYVALTKCRKKLYIFSSEKEKSTFIKELDPLLANDQIEFRRRQVWSTTTTTP